MIPAQGGAPGRHPEEEFGESFVLEVAGQERAGFRRSILQQERGIRIPKGGLRMLIRVRAADRSGG